MRPHRSLCVLMAYNELLWILINLYALLLVVLSPYRFRCVLIDSNGLWCVLINPYSSLKILLCPNGSLWVFMRRYGSSCDY